MKRLLAALLLLVPAAGGAQLSDAEFEALQAFDDWLLQAMVGRPLETVADIRALGALRAETSHPYRSPHDGSPREIRQFVFDGLTVTAHVDPAPDRAWITTIDITGPGWTLDNGLAVGRNMSRLARLPVPPQPDGLEFCGITNCLIAETEDGLINRLRIELYLD